MVFAANAGTVIGGVVLGAQFRDAQRAAEAGHYRRWFIAHGAPDMVMPRAVNEGAGDLVWTGWLLLAGTGFRTEPEVVGLGCALAARGFEPVFADVSELRRAGGGPKCCTLELRS